MNVLISLHRGYGLGDAIQMSSVLKHVVKYRPHWKIDYQAEAGKQEVGNGIVSNTFVYGSKYPSPHYDAEVQICLYDTWANWGDRPNTRVSSVLHEQFGLPWDRECARYQVNISRESTCAANALVNRVMSVRQEQLRPRVGYVAIHYQGDSSQDKKNLSNDQIDKVCKHIENLGYLPLILDWRGRSPLKYRKINTPSFWGSSAEMVSAVIRECVAFVGIDSGPSKCASSTDVPTLVTWTGHHPAPFHDPAPNTTHLVPVGYNGLYPVCNNSEVIKWFESNYNVRTYENRSSKDESSIPEEINKWLSETLYK